MRRSEMATAGSNRFTVTCGLLRQYIMEHNHQQSPLQIGGLACSFLLPPPHEAMDDAEETDARTMQLFPTHAGTSQPSQQRPEEQVRTPLTIFYEGRMLVFDDFPADKAKELMQLAGRRSSSSPALKNEMLALPGKPVITESSSLPPDLPIARKASLKRFLQKRKHRIIASDPYYKETSPGKEAAEGKPVKDEPAASWLAL